MPGILASGLRNFRDVRDLRLQRGDRARQLYLHFARRDRIDRLARLLVGDAMHVAQHLDQNSTWSNSRRSRA